MLTRQVSLVRTQYRVPVASLRKEAEAISSPISVVAPQERKSAVVSFRKIAHGRYLQALLTKREIELKLSQCKIQ
jgi:hypothetical protein